MCMKDLKELDISESLKEIKNMTKNQFSRMLKQKVDNRALNYLKEKQRVKGKEIVYKKIEMAEYLSPLNSEFTIEEKRKLFGIRNDMILMNFSKQNKICSCGKNETLEHIYSCKSLNNEENEIPFQNIYSKNIKNQREAFRRMEIALKSREKIRQNVTSSPSDLLGSATL